MRHWKHHVTAAVVAGVTTVVALAAGAGTGPAAATTPPDSTEPAPAVAPVENGPERTIVVNGHGAVSVPPDLATVWMGVQTTAPTSQEAMDALAEKSNALIATLTGVGIAAEDLQTSGLNLWPQYGADGTRIEGYQASTNVTVKVRDVARVGEVIDAASGFVGNELTLGGISFSAVDPEAVLQDARIAAIDNARIRAEQYADAAGVTVGEVVRIVEASASDPSIFRGMEMAAADEAGSVAVEPGQQELTVDVTVVFAMG